MSKGKFGIISRMIFLAEVSTELFFTECVGASADGNFWSKSPIRDEQPDFSLEMTVQWLSR